MSRVTTSIRRLSPVLLALIALRALVPTGYMPASAGSGFLFEMCHDAVPVAVLAAMSDAASHGHHHGSSDGSDHEVVSSDACSLGHMLSQVFLESDPVLDVVSPELATPETPTQAYRLSLAPRYRQAPRGPPLA